MRKIIGLALIGIMFISVCPSVSLSFSLEEDSWPSVKEESREYVFSDSNDSHVAIDICSQDGRKLYDLQCHPGDYPKDLFFDYSGFFHCRLRSLYSEEELGSLLTDSFEDTKEWENRGRFLIEHILPDHENYKDWGRERHFRLRGMEIILKIWDEVLKKKNNGSIEDIEGFKFSVDIKNCPSSSRAISEHPNNPEPKWFYGE